ncbi:MAG: hypothetical protein MN733_22940, partial [Nitrososphaera sp.]|nr:hypothetical protein [Nitrososphaera sp.]
IDKLRAHDAKTGQNTVGWLSQFLRATEGGYFKDPDLPEPYVQGDDHNPDQDIKCTCQACENRRAVWRRNDHRSCDLTYVKKQQNLLVSTSGTKSEQIAGGDYMTEDQLVAKIDKDLGNKDPD